MRVLSDNILRCMSKKDREKLGQRTADEVLANGVAKSEKELQKQIISLLRLKGIEVNVSRMDKRKTDRVGWPDLTFAVEDPNYGANACACLWEIKLPGRELDAEQEAMRVTLTESPNSWRHRVVHSVDEALSELRKMGL